MSSFSMVRSAKTVELLPAPKIFAMKLMMMEERVDCRSISMRNGRVQAPELANEAEDDQTPLLGTVGEEGEGGES